jgi:flagellar biosynthetic protein FliR
MLAITLGFIMRIVFTTAAVAGEYIAGAMGLSFASVVDPQTGGGTPVLAQFMTIFLTLIFLTLNGPVILVTIISDSFLILPLGGFQISYEALLRVALAGSYMFFSAVILMAPVGLSLFLTNIAIGFLTRLSPQMNIFSVGFPFSILLGLAMLAFSLPGMEVQMNNILLAAFEKTREILVLNDWIKG